MKGMKKVFKRSGSSADFAIPPAEQMRKEFEDLTRKAGDTRGKTSEVGGKEENQTKNRYNNVLPYDHTRVKLKDLEGDVDYINANYVSFKGFSERYIAASAPPKNAIIDFWQMIFEKRVASIVMLTNELEMGKRKCDRYWPPRDKIILYGDIGVKMLEEHVCKNYTWRQFQVVSKKLKKGLMVRQFHFTTWPDFDVPDSPVGLIAMMQAVREWNPQNKHNVVHCSAGVGRTGTYFVIEIGRKELQKGKQPNVYKLVEEMREQRAGMIQAYEQYAFCYKTLGQSFDEKELEAEHEDIDTYLCPELDKAKDKEKKDGEESSKENDTPSSTPGSPSPSDGNKDKAAESKDDKSTSPKKAEKEATS